MVRTGGRVTVLAGLLLVGGLVIDPEPPPRARFEDLGPEGAEAVLDLYRELGGRLDAPFLRPGPWDLAMSGTAIELDEELHFNRYRGATLTRPWTDDLPWAPAYRRFVQDHEQACLRAGRWGRRWTSAPSVRQFGTGAPPGDLDSPGGAPRWKQRALYDAIKDAHAAGGRARLARLSIHDEVAGVSLGRVLEGKADLAVGDLMTLLAQRTAPAKAN
jgi:hypothetical protein